MRQETNVSTRLYDIMLTYDNATCHMTYVTMVEEHLLTVDDLLQGAYAALNSGCFKEPQSISINSV